VRQRVIEQLAEWGPRVGVPALRAAFPEVQRAELEDLLRRFRAVYRARNGRWVAALLWLRVGAVWAADFGRPPAPLPGGYDRLLCVRDLASGMQLAWRPTHGETAEAAVRVLAGLFLVHGPPLVLKLDNGSAYRAEQMQKALAGDRVLVLHSPAYNPEYNGSAEAGVGSMKTRTHEQAERAGHPGLWTAEDAERARLEANVFSVSPVDPHRSPQQVWDTREPLRAEEREALAAKVNTFREQEKAQQVTASPEADVKEPSWRVLLRRALRSLGYLLLRWRRIPPVV
jgi:transposase InsO family protein